MGYICGLLYQLHWTWSVFSGCPSTGVILVNLQPIGSKIT